MNMLANDGEIKASNPCASRGSRLLTDQGWIKVEDLVDKEVSLYDGISFTSGKVWKTGHKKLVRLETSGGRALDVTPDHRIYTTEGWKEAKDCLGLTIPIRQLNRLGILGTKRLPKCITGGSGKYYSYAAQDLMETLGFIQGDGTLHKTLDRLIIYYTPKKDNDFIDKIVLPLLSDIAAQPDKTYIPGTTSSNGYVWNSKKLLSWLRTIGMSDALLPVRILPEFVFKITHNAQAAFLRGLFGANGNILVGARKAIVLVATCKKLLQEVQLILQSMGIMSRVYRHNKTQEIKWPNGTYVSKESYHLTIDSQESVYTFAHTIGFPQVCQTKKLESIIPITKRTSNTAIRPNTETIKTITKITNADVYDFSCSTTHMGLANGLVVHNCGEFLSLNNSACNLASLNLRKFQFSNGDFDSRNFDKVARIMLTAQDILIDRASYPTREICENSHRYRQIGLGYTNFGAFLMCAGQAYDSDEGRSTCAEITEALQSVAVKTSAELAEHLGTFDAYEDNKEAVERVLDIQLLASK